MSGSVRLMLTILAAVFVGFFVYKVVLSLVATVLHILVTLVIPLLIVGSVAVILYSVINRRALGGGRRTLP